MKTLNNKIRTILLCFTLVFSINIHSQRETKKQNIFVRVYNLDGKKIAKGHIVFINDTILGLKKGSKIKEVNYFNIGHIKTKRSGGNNLLAGALVGAITGVVLGVATADPDAWVLGYSASEGAIGFGALGAIGGASIGGITIGFKNSETYQINADISKWQVFKEMH